MSTSKHKSISKNVNKKIDKNKDKNELLPFGCSSRAAICVVFCAICCLAVLFVAKWDVLSPSAFSDWFAFSGASDEDYPTDIMGTSVLEHNIHLSDTGVAYISDTSVVRLDINGKVIFNQQHSFTKPVMKSSGEFAVVYSLGGGSFRIISETEELYRGTQGSSIVDCDINSSGVYCIVSDQTGYLSNLSVYDVNNNLIYSYSFNDYYVVSVSLSEKGDAAVVGAVNTSNGEMVSAVYVLDFSKTEPVKVFEYNDQMLYDVSFINDNHYAVVTDSLVSVVECTKYREVPYSFDNRVLTGYDFSYDNGVFLSLSRSGDGRDCSVVSLNCEGSEVGSFSTSLKVSTLNVRDDKIACLSEGHLYIYNTYGDSFGNWDVGSDARNVILTKSKYVYILGVSEIRRISIK